MLVATAGHVDHGKTSLVKHLTGTDTDRLAEEQRRGLTIELGYAFASLDGGVIGFIDVPGHKSFINTMISGVTGVDLGLLVVAADDGPRAQTLEHLQVLELLGVSSVIVVLTKIDQVELNRQHQVTESLNRLLPNAQVCSVSNRTGAGLDELRAQIKQSYRSVLPRSASGFFRLYVDRSFIIKGAGVVVTGTSLSGAIHVGDEVVLHAPADGQYDSGIKLRVREIHAQGQSVAVANSGQRCALNLAGKITPQKAPRGSLVTNFCTARGCSHIDVRFRPSPQLEQPLKHLARVRLHIGTRKIAALAYLLDDVASSPRIQLILDQPVIAFIGDLCLLRSDNGAVILGGGTVIDPLAPQWGKKRPKRIAELDALESGDPSSALHGLLVDRAVAVNLDWFQRIWNLTPQQCEKILLPYINEHAVVQVATQSGQLVVATPLWQSYQATILRQVMDWHSSRPMEAGVAMSELVAQVHGELPLELIMPVVKACAARGDIIHDGKWLKMTGHRPTLSPIRQREWQQLERVIRSFGVNLPLRSEILKESDFDADQLDRLVRPALNSGELFAIGSKRLSLPEPIILLAERLKTAFDGEAGLTVIEVKQLFQLGRNLTIEVLEFFDQIGLTQRKGDIRILRNPDAMAFLAGKSTISRKSDTPGGVPGLQNQ